MIEFVTLVDENDRVIGKEEKLLAHEKALKHRAFSIFILRRRHDDIELLLQKRHPDKYHCGGLWTNTCCGHPRPGEDIIAAGCRRLQEETGIKDIALTDIESFSYTAKFTNKLTENELDHVLLGFSKEQQKIAINPQEIIEIKWLNLHKLSNDLKENPSKYTPWFFEAFDIIFKKLQSNVLI